MEVKIFQHEDKADAISLLIRVYNAEPWNDEWTVESATRLVEDFTANPSFIGYAAYMDDKLAGVALGRKRIWWRGDELLIEEFYIDATYQGKGIGTAMISYMESDLKEQGIHTITLLTNDNVPAYNFYMKNEFKELSRIKFLFKNI